MESSGNQEEGQAMGNLEKNERQGSWNDNTCIKLVQDRERWNWNLWKVFVCGLCSGAGSVSNGDDDDDDDGGDDADDGDDAAADDDDADDDGDDDDVCLRLVKSNFIQQMSDILFSYFFKVHMIMNKEREHAPSS